MTSPVRTIRAADSLRRCHDRLEELGISCLAVVEDDLLVGAISRTDLLETPSYDGRTVGDAMTSGALTVGLDDPLDVACRAMVDNDVHRVFVCNRGAPAGVVSTRDVMLAIRDERREAPIADYMSSPIVAVRSRATLADATKDLEQAGITGLVVVEDDWPVGVFRQLEALRSRGLPPDTPVEDAMDPAMICMPADTRLHRAAEQATAMHALRIIACRDRRMVGILTGLDFARAYYSVAESA